MALALVAASCHGGAATVPHADAAVLDAAPSRIATDTARPLTDVVESGLIVDAAASEDASDGEDADLLGPRLFIMKDWYDFTPIGGAQPSPYLVDVVNAGEAGTGPVTVAMLGPDAARFIIMQNTCSVLAAHARCAIVVAFDPSSDCVKSATLQVSARPGGSASVDLTGANQRSILSWSPAAADFGTVAPGSTIPPKRLTLRNGPCPTAPVAVTLGSSVFKIAANTCGPSRPLGANETCDVDVTFQPPGPGHYGAGLTAEEFIRNTTIATLTGFVPNRAQLVLDQTDRDLGTRHNGDYPTAFFHLTNTGPSAERDESGPLSIRYEGAAFKGSDDCRPQGLFGQWGCTIALLFHPAGPGTYEGKVTITAEPGGTVTGTVRAIAVSP